MPTFSGLCPTRRTNMFSWLFGGASAAHSKLTVEVSTADERAREHIRNRIVNTSYNLRPRRAAVNYREAATDAEDSDGSEEA
jgi:hypothetical protein